MILKALLPDGEENAMKGQPVWTTSRPNELLVPSPVAKQKCPPPISKLRIEKVEGGLVVAGVVVAANCQIILPIFGFLFMLVGCVLTATSYRGCGENEEPDHYAARIAFTGNSRILGPICIVVGAIMSLAGVGLILLMRSAQRRQRRVAFRCPIHGDFYPVKHKNNQYYQRNDIGICTTFKHWLGLLDPTIIPRCPRSEELNPQNFVNGCPPALPFFVQSNSVLGLVANDAPISPDQAYGSIKSLTITREVASFPLSRSPTPPPLSCPQFKTECSQDLPYMVQDIKAGTPSPTFTYEIVECKMINTDEIKNVNDSESITETEQERKS